MQPCTKSEISYCDFEKIDLRIGTILSIRTNETARKPAYVLEIDFGHNLGRKTASAQITEAYAAENLVGLQVIAVVNFPPKQVAKVRSEVLVLGVVQDAQPTILLTPSQPVTNGSVIC